ncbi:hypothetical protein ANO11243_032120 [Dothideomycetidae sp. 11243]|nr:hypothetical protein ANO11243_032120 [fungal sp. No.11243]
MSSSVTFSLASSRPPADRSQSHAAISPPQPNGIKRSHASLDDDSEDEAGPSKQAVTHFNSKGAYNSAKPKKDNGPLVIHGQANRDWRDASKAAQAQKRARYGLPSQRTGEDAKSREAELKRLEDANKPTFGLNVKAKKPDNDDQTTLEQPEIAANKAVVTNGSSDEVLETAPPAKARTDDERAMDALLGIKEQSDLTIPAATEEEAFQRDFKDAPPMPTLEQYAATPVEEFGAALLRGMGWVDGQGIGNQSGKKVQKAKIPERRPALLGIGAKEEAAVKEEMGAWGRGARKGKVDQVYNPVIMRNKKTGEEVTEEEMKAKMDQLKSREREVETDGLAYRRKEDEKEGRHRDELSDMEYERRRREKRKDRERRERDEHRRDRERPGDRNDRRYRDRHDGRRHEDSDRPRERDRDRDRDSRNDGRRGNDGRHDRVESHLRDRSERESDNNDRRRRH